MIFSTPLRFWPIKSGPRKRKLTSSRSWSMSCAVRQRLRFGTMIFLKPGQRYQEFVPICLWTDLDCGDPQLSGAPQGIEPWGGISGGDLQGDQGWWLQVCDQE